MDLGISQETLAQRAGVSQYNVSRIENSTSDQLPKPYLLNAIAKALAMPVERLLAHAGYDVDADDDDDELDDPTLVNWQAEGAALSPEERHHYLRLIEFARREEYDDEEND